MTEIAIRETSSGTLSLTGDQTEWSPVQQAALAHIGIAEAPPADQQVFMHVCQRTGLDPFNREIYMIARREKQTDGSYQNKWTIQTGIDGFRNRAEEHPKYAGTLDPEWCGADGVWKDAWVELRPPVAARVKVLRHDRAHHITLPVRFIEFAAYFKDGNLQGQWKTKPAHMIAKVAEAAALRKAFPKTFAGLYTDDEMAHVDNPRPRQATGRAVGITSAELRGEPVVVVDADLDDDAGDPAPEQPAPADTGDGQTAAGSNPPSPPPVDVDVNEGQAPDEPVANQAQHRAMHRLWNEAGLADKRDDRLLVTRDLLRDPSVTTSKTLTVAKASALIDALGKLKGKHPQHDLAAAVNDLLNDIEVAAEHAREQAAAEPDGAPQ